jgi:hypothetical protein
MLLGIHAVRLCKVVGLHGRYKDLLQTSPS